MKQQQFQETYEGQWMQLNKLLDGLEHKRKKNRPTSSELEQLPDLYISVCQHLSLAQYRCYGPKLIDRLQQLAMRAHHHLYRRKLTIGLNILEFFIETFPRTLRRHTTMFWIATALFYIPLVGFSLLCYFSPEMIYLLLSEEVVVNMEYMYRPTENDHITGRLEDQEDSSRVYMLGYYLNNNIGVSFRTFAGGMLAGIGTLFFLLLNGIFLGGISGYLTQLGYIDTFWGFVIGHGSFEITAIVISGAAGLLIGHGIIAPGNLSRGAALRKNAREAVLLVSGSALMLVVAALIEAFWSPLPIEPIIKYTVGGFLWILVFAYLFFAGRNLDAD